LKNKSLKLFSAEAAKQQRAHWMNNAPVSFLWKPKRAEKNAPKTFSPGMYHSSNSQGLEAQGECRWGQTFAIRRVFRPSRESSSCENDEGILGARRSAEPITRLLF
tara:strand:+ start:38 stop:355 length:318 start_codon:yes stop_codon:yes gene_type:complete